jgi:hypothetical protein
MDIKDLINKTCRMFWTHFLKYRFYAVFQTVSKYFPSLLPFPSTATSYIFSFHCHWFEYLHNAQLISFVIFKESLQFPRSGKYVFLGMFHTHTRTLSLSSKNRTRYRKNKIKKYILLPSKCKVLKYIVLTYCDDMCQSAEGTRREVPLTEHGR